jgi:hypothetical protein
VVQDLLKWIAIEWRLKQAILDSGFDLDRNAVMKTEAKTAAPSRCKSGRGVMALRR